MTEVGLDPAIVDLLALARPVLAGLPRFGAALLFLPLLPNAVVPKRLRAGIAIALVLFAYPMLAATVVTTGWGLDRWILYVLKESLIGAAIGYAMGVVLWALAAVGELIDVQAGFNNAQIFDPFAGHAAGPVSVLTSQLGIMLFVAFGGLQVFLQLLYESLRLWPPASFQPELSAAFRDLAVSTSGSLLELAARLAVPLIGALLIVELGIGLINRAAPQFNAFYFALPVKALAALLVLVLLLGHWVDVVRARLESSEGLLQMLDRVWRVP